MNSNSSVQEFLESTRGRVIAIIASVIAVIMVIASAYMIRDIASSDTPVAQQEIQGMTAEEMNELILPPAEKPAVEEEGQAYLPPAPPPAQPTGESPISITITRAGQDFVAPIDALCLTDNNGGCDDSTGRFNPPTDVSRVGWWDKSAKPGDPNNGSIVLSGHINYGGQTGYAALIQTLNPGDTITLKTGSGAERTYAVREKSTYIPKDITEEEYVNMTRETINKKDGGDFITFITCGGDYIGGMLGYEDNEILTAYPV